MRIGYEADESDLPEILSDPPPEVNRMAEARRRISSVTHELGLQPTSDELTLCAIVLVAIEEDVVGGPK